jgi:RNA polymerase sigma factor (sigma-70 family)
LARWSVPVADRDDISQEALLRAYQCRESFDPSNGDHVPWAYAIFGGVVRNYRKVRARRLKRVDVAASDLPEVAVDAPSPEEETDDEMTRALFDKCLAGLDADARAILLARDRDGIPMPEIASAQGVSVSTAYAYYQDAREQLQTALDREQNRKRALGLAVLPIGLDQLLGSEPAPAAVGADTMERIWKKLDRAMAADKAAGRLGDDGTAVERYMGVPKPAPRVGPLGRALRPLLDPRVLPAVTGLLGAAGGAIVAFAIMRAPPGQPDGFAVAAHTGEAAAASSARLRGPASSDAPGPERSAPAPDTPELRAEAGAPAMRASSGALAPRVAAGAPELRPDAGPAARDDLAREQALYDQGSTLYQEGKYSDAIEAFQKEANEHPGGRFAAARDRLWTLALIRAGRKDEARRRIERLRQANPESPLLRELDEAMNQK